MPVFNEPVEINGHDLTMRHEGAVSIHLNVSNSDLTLGGGGANGEVLLLDPDGNRLAHLAPTFMTVRNEEGDRTVWIDGGKADVRLGGGGANGEIQLFDASANLEDAERQIRALLAPTFLSMKSAEGVEMVRIDGEDGDIMLFGADCAELFDAGDADAREPGTVLVVDDRERLWPCQQAYDRRVAGIVSGAGGLRPGVVLGARTARSARVPIALTGKAYCKVDALFGAIAVGDLLTTSPTQGHAMTASDPARAFGAVIGKALRAHGEGLGLIPVLVALQ